MFDYLLLTLAGLLLALMFAVNKVCQKKFGDDAKTVLVLNLLAGVFKVIIFGGYNIYSIGKFTEITWYSVICATVVSGLCVFYTLLGFKVMSVSSVSLYTLFLMTGGTALPYLFGLVFLNEQASPLRIIGIIVMIASIVLANRVDGKFGKKAVILCGIIFLMNGFVSIFSKIHSDVKNISWLSFQNVSANSFVVLTGILTVVLCAICIPFTKGSVSAKKLLLSKEAIFLNILVALTSGISYAFQLIGAANLPATVVYPFVTGGSIVFTSFVSLLAFKEKPDLRMIIGIVLCFVGTILFV